MKHEGVLISFSGIDGSGKSTQIKLLSEYLKSSGKKVKSTEEMFGYFLLKPLIGFLRAKTGSPSGGPVKRNKKILPKFWSVLAFVDIWVGFLFKICPMLNKYDYVIGDRFYTDIWANLLYYGYLPNWAFGSFVKLLPRSDIAFLLSVKPEVVLKRENDFPPEYYRQQEKIYKNLARYIDFNIVNADRDPRTVFAEIKPLLELEKLQR